MALWGARCGGWHGPSGARCFKQAGRAYRSSCRRRIKGKGGEKSKADGGRGSHPVHISKEGEPRPPLFGGDEHGVCWEDERCGPADWRWCRVCYFAVMAAAQLACIGIG